MVSSGTSSYVSLDRFCLRLRRVRVHYHGVVAKERGSGTVDEYSEEKWDILAGKWAPTARKNGTFWWGNGLRKISEPLPRQIRGNGEGVGVSGRADRLAGCQPGGSKGHQETLDTA